MAPIGACNLWVGSQKIERLNMSMEEHNGDRKHNGKLETNWRAIKFMPICKSREGPGSLLVLVKKLTDIP
jgi:hypothetical protein